MMELFRTILLRVTLAGAASSLALSVAKDSALKEIVRIAAGLLMALALLQPLSGLRLIDLARRADTAAGDVSIAELEAQNRQTTLNAMGAAVASALEQRASEIGIECTVLVTMATDEDGLLQTDHVTVFYRKKDAARLAELQELILKESGVPADRQELIEK